MPSFYRVELPSLFRPRSIHIMAVSAVPVKLVDRILRQRRIERDAIQSGRYEAARPSPAPARRPTVTTLALALVS